MRLTDGIVGRIEPGEGDKILWLHGYTLDSSSWGELWSLLPGWYHIGIDLPGHGASELLAEGSNLRDLGFLLGNLCREQNIRHAVAISFGTIMAIQIAIEFPNLFSSITLGAPAIAGGAQDPEMAAVYSRLIILYKQTGPTQELQNLWLSSRAWRGIEKRAGLKEALYSLVARHSWAELESYSRIKQFTYPTQREEDLQRITSPLLILVGQREMPAFRKCADIIMSLAPNCRRHELYDTDHLCLLQSPHLTVPLMLTHLREHSVVAPPEAQ